MSTVQRPKLSLSQQAPKMFSLFRATLDAPAIPSLGEKAFSLFEPDILLPTQYYETTRRKRFLEPEKKLMLAILEDAIWCYQSGLLARGKRRKRLFSEAQEWIMEENSSWIFSFDNVCDVLGFNPKYVRAGLMRWRAKAPKGRPKAQVHSLAHIFLPNLRPPHP